MASPGKWCICCGEQVYLVQNHKGEQFLVDHYGRRWCPKAG